MYVIVNNEKIETEKELSVTELLGQINFDASRGVAIAVGHEVLPKSDWQNFLLKGGEHITIIKATQGG